MVEHALWRGARNFDGMIRLASDDDDIHRINSALFYGAKNLCEALQLTMEANEFWLFDYAWAWMIFMGREACRPDLNDYLYRAAHLGLNNFCLQLVGRGADNFRELIFIAARTQNNYLFDLALAKGWDPEGVLRYGIDIIDLKKNILYHAVMHDNNHMIKRINKKISC